MIAGAFDQHRGLDELAGIAIALFDGGGAGLCADISRHSRHAAGDR
jgi:hypothetical protein